MYVEGLARRRSSFLPTSLPKRDSCAIEAPSFAASASANQNPASWRVAAQRRPGFPSPATRRIGSMASWHEKARRPPSGARNAGNSALLFAFLLGGFLLFAAFLR